MEEKSSLFTYKEQTYWTRQMHNCSGNAQLFWPSLNSILLRTDAYPPASELLTAQALADYFQDKVAKVRANTLSYRPPTFISYCVAQFDEFLPCTKGLIRYVILQSPIKSCQLDPIPHALFKMSLELLLPFLHFTCNISLRDGTLPDCEKLANITPI